MKKSPVYPKQEANDHYNAYEYNPHTDFSLFLEEAKRSERPETDHEITQAKPEEPINKKSKKKKLWKALLLPWLKFESKFDKPQVVSASTSSRDSKTRRGFASGPVFSSVGKARDNGARKPLSGPLMSSLFTPIKKIETEIPYMCLDQLGSSCHAKNYGPVYSVS